MNSVQKASDVWAVYPMDDNNTENKDFQRHLGELRIWVWCELEDLFLWATQYSNVNF